MGSHGGRFFACFPLLNCLAVGPQDFTPSANLESSNEMELQIRLARIEAWGQPPYSIENGTLAPAFFFFGGGGGWFAVLGSSLMRWEVVPCCQGPFFEGSNNPGPVENDTFVLDEIHLPTFSSIFHFH